MESSVAHGDMKELQSRAYFWHCTQMLQTELQCKIALKDGQEGLQTLPASCGMDL